MSNARIETRVNLQRVKLLSRAALSVAVSLHLFGCPQADKPDASESPAVAYSGVKLKLAMPASLALSDQWAPAVNDWAGENDASVEIVEVAFSTAPSVWMSQLRESPTTLIVLPTTQIGELVGAGLAATIPVELIESDVIAWHQIPPNVRSTLDTLGEEPAFITVDCPTPAVVVRADLLEAARLSLPTTWSEYDRLVTNVAKWAPDHTAVEPRADEFLPTLFLARAISGAHHPAGLSVELDVSNGDPLIASPPYLRALTEMQALSSNLAKEARSMSPVDCLNALGDGRAAIGIVWETDKAPLAVGGTDLTATSEAASNERGELLFTSLPGRQEVFNRDDRAWEAPPDGDIHRPVLCGFAGLSIAVTKTGDDRSQAAAWDLWALLAAYQAEGMIPKLPARSPTTTLATGAAAVSGLNPEENAQYRKLQSAEQQNRWLICELPMLGHSQLRSALGTAIARTLDDKLNPAVGLEDAQQKWTDIIDELGRTKVLNSDRMRLGLVPVAE